MAIATSNKVSQCLEVGRKQERGRSGRNRKGQIRGEVGYDLCFSLKTCRLQLQNPQLDSHNLSQVERPDLEFISDISAA